MPIFPLKLLQTLLQQHVSLLALLCHPLPPHHIPHSYTQGSSLVSTPMIPCQVALANAPQHFPSPSQGALTGRHHFSCGWEAADLGVSLLDQINVLLITY